MRMFVLAGIALALTGCSLLDAKQIAALSKIKDAGATCVSVHQPIYGDLRITTASVDKGIYGQTVVAADCSITITTIPGGPR